MIQIPPSVRLSPLADIEDSIRGSRIIFGEHGLIDAFVKIKPAGGSGDLIAGDHVMINSGCVFYTGNGIKIGNHVAVAANCTFAPTNHEFRSSGQLISQQGFKPSRGGIVIGNDVWIGANTVILDGSVIDDGCVIGACSLVRGKLDAYGIYTGNPLKKVSERR